MNPVDIVSAVAFGGAAVSILAVSRIASRRAEAANAATRRVLDSLRPTLPEAEAEPTPPDDGQPQPQPVTELATVIQFPADRRAA